MISGHRYRRNGLGGVDENGNVPCGQCGLTEGAHTSRDAPAADRGDSVTLVVYPEIPEYVPPRWAW